MAPDPYGQQTGGQLDDVEQVGVFDHGRHCQRHPRGARAAGEVSSPCLTVFVGVGGPLPYAILGLVLHFLGELLTLERGAGLVMALVAPG